MKRSLIIVALLGASGCLQNKEDLQQVLAESDRILAEEKLRADSLLEARKEFAQLDESVREAVAAAPELQKEIDALPPIDVPPPTIESLPVPPDVGTFEGPDQARLRRQIADTQSRVNQLRKISEEFVRLEARRRRLEMVRKLIEAKKLGP